MTELSVVIPTREREHELSETLRRIDAQATGLPVEVIVVHDGPPPEPASGPPARVATAPLSVLEQPPRGPAAARNRGIDAASGAAVLLLGDDVWAEPGLLSRHLEFHRANPDPGAALLGLVTPAPPLDRSEFVRWLHLSGVQFAYGDLRAGEVPASCFWTANVSVKTGFVREVGGFDEAFGDAACEDAELGVRLASAGMRLHHDPAAAARHHHPTDLERTLTRMRRVGIAYRLLGERVPELAMPRPPGPRHRLRAAALTAAFAGGVRTAPIRRASWRFLCDEAQREAYWGIEPEPGRRLRLGDRLARLAIADQLAREPAPRPPGTPGRGGGPAAG